MLHCLGSGDSTFPSPRCFNEVTRLSAFSQDHESMHNSESKLGRAYQGFLGSCLGLIMSLLVLK